MRYLKRYKIFENKLGELVDSEQFFYDLEDDGFIISTYTNKKGDKSGIQSHIKISKPKTPGDFKASVEFKRMEPFDFEEIRGHVIRFIEMTNIDVKYMYVYKYIPGRSVSDSIDMLYDPKGVTRFYKNDPLLQDGNNKILDDDYEIGDILQLVIIYGFI